VEGWPLACVRKAREQAAVAWRKRLMRNKESQFNHKENTAVFRGANFAFWGILLVFAVWVLALPIFPTQDGPMHRYYVHVLDSLLQHKTAYDVYEIRHPFPPYLTQYSILLVLFHFMSYDFAEKLFTCLVLFCLAFGLRLAAQEISPSGRWVSLLFAPILFSWPLMMGFFNFTLGIGLTLFCMAFWQKMKYRGVSSLVVFALILAVLTFTHPVPLLLLIALCGFDVLLSLLFRSRGLSFPSWLRQERLQVIALCLTFVAAAFPALAVDSSKTGRALELLHFHPEFLRTSLLLSGMSPYNTRSLNFSIDLYRLCLYALYFWAMWVGGKAALRALRERRLNFGTTLFLATALLTLALPALPNEVNGSWYFTSRLVFVLWPGALLAASAMPQPNRAEQRLFLVGGAVCGILTLFPAQLFIRPAAKELRLAEQLPIPQGVPGSLLLGDNQDDYARFHDQIGFDPYKWGAILSFVREDDIALDSPWIDQKITPIEAVPGGPELVDDVALVRISKTNPPAVKGRSLPAHAEARIVHDSSFMVFGGSHAELAQGLANQLSPSEQAKFHCERSHVRYIVCTSAAK